MFTARLNFKESSESEKGKIGKLEMILISERKELRNQKWNFYFRGKKGSCSVQKERESREDGSELSIVTPTHAS